LRGRSAAIEDVTSKGMKIATSANTIIGKNLNIVSP